VDQADHAREAVAPVLGEMLGDADFGQKLRGFGEDFLRGGTTVEVAEHPGNGAGDLGVAVGLEVAETVSEFGYEPQVGDATGDLEFVAFQVMREVRAAFGPLHEGLETFEGILDEFKFGDEFLPFFGQGHFERMAPKS
jgi:hypothetical protein